MPSAGQAPLGMTYPELCDFFRDDTPMNREHHDDSCTGIDTSQGRQDVRVLMKAILILLISLFLPAAGRCAGKLSQAELLSRVVIPHFEVIDSPATDFYGFLAEMGREYASTSDVQQAAINIIVALPPAAANRSITFKANNASLLAILLASTRQHGLTCEFSDGYALIGPGPARSPERRAAGDPAAASASAATTTVEDSRAGAHPTGGIRRIGEGAAAGD